MALSLASTVQWAISAGVALIVFVVGFANGLPLPVAVILGVGFLVLLWGLLVLVIKWPSPEELPAAVEPDPEPASPSWFKTRGSAHVTVIGGSVTGDLPFADMDDESTMHISGLEWRTSAPPEVRPVGDEDVSADLAAFAATRPAQWVPEITPGWTEDPVPVTEVSRWWIVDDAGQVVAYVLNPQFAPREPPS